MARSFSLWQLSDELRSLSRASEEDQKWNLVASKLAIVEQMRAQTEDGDISSSIDSKTNRADDGFFPKLNINSSSSSGCFFNARVGGIARNGGNKINSNSNNNNSSYSNASYSGAVAGTQQQQTSGNVTDKRFKCLPPAETLPWQETLGGYIFVCNNDTMLEDLKRQLFGLPQRYRDSVRTIQPGLPLFLYNYTTHQLHGIFEAASFGGSNIDPTAWGDKKNKGESRFPAQVRTRVRKLCKPLEEDSFRPVLHHYDGPKFRLQLSVPETLALLDLFEEAGSS